MMQFWKMLNSRSFWNGFFSVFTCPILPSHPSHLTHRKVMEEEPIEVLSDAECLAQDWCAVNDDLWHAMDEFERQYGSKPVSENKTEGTHQEVFNRFERLVKDYDKPSVILQCASCKAERLVGKFSAQEGCRCRCGGFMVAVKVQKQ